MTEKIVDKLKRLEWITGYRWGVVPFWYGDRSGDISNLLRFNGWACVREDEIERYLSRKRYLYGVDAYPRSRDNVAFEDMSPEGAVSFALKTLDPDGSSLRVAPHYLGVFGAVNRQNETLYLIQVDIEERMKRVYARAEDNSAIIIWKDWQDGGKDIDLEGFKAFLTNASVRELEKKAGMLKPSPCPSSI